jgi:hypothetical protein
VNIPICKIDKILLTEFCKQAGIAQLGERQTEDLKVACSIHAHRIDFFCNRAQAQAHHFIEMVYNSFPFFSFFDKIQQFPLESCFHAIKQEGSEIIFILFEMDNSLLVYFRGIKLSKKLK